MASIENKLSCVISQDAIFLFFVSNWIIIMFDLRFAWFMSFSKNLIWDRHNLFKGEAYLMIMIIQREAFWTPIDLKMEIQTYNRLYIFLLLNRIESKFGQFEMVFFLKKIFWFPMLLKKIFWFWWREKKNLIQSFCHVT
jgi:hypothetical protein